ncbi:MAG: ATP-binding protein [Phycisphaerales bacterium]|jgi:two-component system sensor histidine kinase BarA
MFKLAGAIFDRIRRLALADKALVLFGAALVLIIVIALGVAWLRMSALVTSGELQLSRQKVDSWRAAGGGDLPPPGEATDRLGIVATWHTVESARQHAEDDPFLRRALERFLREGQPNPELRDHRWRYESGILTRTERTERYARAIRGPSIPSTDPEQPATPGQLEGIITLERPAEGAAWLMAVNAIYLLNAGAAVLAVAVTLFYLLLHRIILKPVEVLRRAADRVREGDLAHRVDVGTRDEFEELANAFNAMLIALQANEQRLRAAGSALESRVSELAEANKILFDANRLKSDFLANVSHELRTPLNSINGFAELLLEIAQSSEQGVAETPEQRAKRLRYLQYIHTAGRDLLEMINGLLEMAKLEAGRFELHVQPVSVPALCETLVGLVDPLAQRRQIELVQHVERDLPLIETDPKKLQQVVFNFLSNAVKFTGAPGSTGPMRVELRAERLSDVSGVDRVRISVIDNGPGISPEDQERVFEKFTQVDASRTREHAGTGLGLAIARELAGVLQCEIQLVSDVGRGSMFSVIVPLRLDLQLVEERRAEAQFRDRLAGRRDWASPVPASQEDASREA